MHKDSIILFNNKKVRRHFDEDKEMWYFSIVDVIEILTDSSIPKRYWSDLKAKLNIEGSEVYEKIVQLKFLASDGKKYATDCFSTQDLLRVVQSIPSAKAEPFKVWLSKVGYERIQEMDNPELAFDRAMQTYLKKGYSKEWINQRLKTIEVRKELTDEWDRSGVKKGFEYAMLTDEITKAWSDMTVKDYKKYKGLKTESLRDNMTNLELVLNMLGEVTTTEISKKKNPKTFDQNKEVAKQGGGVAGTARKQIESLTSEKILSPNNMKKSYFR